MSTAVRTVTAGRWRVDPRESSVTFAGKHLLGAITGVVSDVSGTLEVAEDPDDSRADIAIGLASADFGSSFWNDVVRCHDMLGTREHPVARYAGANVRWDGAEGRMDGTLDLHGHRRPVPLRFRCAPAAGAGRRATFLASTRLDRRAFGLRWDLAVVGGDRLVSRDVRLDIRLTVARRR